MMTNASELPSTTVGGIHEGPFRDGYREGVISSVYSSGQFWDVEKDVVTEGPR